MMEPPWAPSPGSKSTPLCSSNPQLVPHSLLQFYVTAWKHSQRKFDLFFVHLEGDRNPFSVSIPWSSSVRGRRAWPGVTSELRTGNVPVGSDLGPCCRGQSHVNKWMFLGSSVNALKPLRKEHKTSHSLSTQHSLRSEQLALHRGHRAGAQGLAGELGTLGGLWRGNIPSVPHPSSAGFSWAPQLPQEQQTNREQTLDSPSAPGLGEKLC